MRATIKTGLRAGLLFLLSLTAGLLLFTLYIDESAAWKHNPLSLYLPLPLILLAAAHSLYTSLTQGRARPLQALYFLLFLMGISVILSLLISKYAALILSIAAYLARAKIPHIRNALDVIAVAGAVTLLIAAVQAAGLPTMQTAIAALIIISLLDWHSTRYLKAGKDIKAGITSKTKNKSTAFVGIGDMIFTQLFLNTAFLSLLKTTSPAMAGLKALIIGAAASASLTILLIKIPENKKYPAMPFISAGCFAAYLLLMLF